MAEAPDYAAFAARYEAGQPSLVAVSLVADLETPVAAFLKLRAGHSGPAFLLESVEGGAVRGRYSMIGLDPDLIWRCREGAPAIARGADLTRFEPDSRAPLASLRALIAESAIGESDGQDLPPMAAGLFVHHPYGIPIIGWMHEIEGLNREHALAYYKRFYTPENAILVVAGDVTPDEVRRLAETTYGRVAPQGARPERLRAREPEPKALRRVAVADPKVEQPTLQRLYLTPSCITARDGGCHDLELLAEVLGGGSTSYLYRKLVMESGLAVNAGAWYMGSAIDDTRFSVYAVPAEGVPLEKLEEAVDRVLRRAPAEALDAEAIERAKTRLVAETVYSSDSQSSLARIYGSALAIGETIEEVRRWPTDIEAVTQDRLKGAAERWLTPARSVTGYLTKAQDPDAPVAMAAE